ncbi:hypothetical protein L0P88_15640 [Muricauda sp. SCSIO 64092]|uniref:hypothetical protein n=1 Tax=Allomuricauda sp. SCSIO 64092 TaxID=2908842 RepID=UPI001FF1CFB4|nr:hypothetical protein [Muricauda sp. SCSIO 64092]UOY05378.1 hypothetical protein L0P88_15640 [Muricauda sp. SCSIO 64092]
MHENLRFNIKPSKINDWQPILATEYIGTFYMIYIKFLEEPQKIEDTWVAPCQFFLQNWRGSITMGLYCGENECKNVEKYLKTEIGLANTEALGYSFRIHVSVKPFYNENQESPIIQLNFGNEFGERIKFETEVDYYDPPKDIFDPDDVSSSKFLHPLFLFREGDNIQHVYYRKDDEDTDTSVTTGGNYDRYRVNVIEGRPVNLSEKGNKPGLFLGTKNSPTCDAKRSEIII